MVDKRKQEVLGAMTQKPHTAHRSTLCPQLHDASKNMPKPLTGAACKYRSASHMTTARRNELPRLSHRGSMTWGFLKTSWWRSKGVYGANRSCEAKSVG